MNKVGNNIRESLLKRQEALKKFKAKKEGFLSEKKKILKDIEQARTIWNRTIQQLPNKEFKY